ncbi:MAG: hypothetical protein KC414_10055 [Romboutsia sp.]|nr:hypothetical protein [Romboutsia sp.]
MNIYLVVDRPLSFLKKPPFNFNPKTDKYEYTLFNYKIDLMHNGHYAFKSEDGNILVVNHNLVETIELIQDGE